MSFEETLENIIRKVVREELQAAAAPDKLLTAEEVAEALSYADVRSVYRLRKENKLPGVSLGGNTWRFRRSDVQRLIQEQAH